MMKAKLLCLLALFITIATPAKRSALPLGSSKNAGRLYPSDRLSSGLITCICQDKYGYIWIGTEYGLNKFDGYRFTQYLNIHSDSTSIIDNYIASLYVDAEGQLWVGCSRGLARYDYDTNHFHRYRFPDDREPRVNALLEGWGRLLIGTAGYGMYSLRKERNHTDYESAFNHRAGASFYSKMHIDRQGCLWRSSHDELMTRFTIKDGHPTAHESLKSPYDMPVAYLDYSADALLIVCKKGILRYSYQTGLLTDAGFDLGCLGTDISLSKAWLDKDGDLYIGTTSNGLAVIRRGSKELTPVENTNRDIDLRLTSVSAITEDRSGNVWIGCYRKGLLTVSKEQEDFESWSFAQQDYRTGGSISSVAADGEGGVWCAMKPGGVYRMNASGRITAHPASPPNVQTLYRDPSGSYWLGTDDVLYRYLPEQGLWTKVKTFGGRGINHIIGDGKGALYISVFGLGLCILDTATGEAEMLDMKQTDHPGGFLCNNWIHTMTLDSDGCLWMATASGIAMMKPEGRVFNSMGWNQLLDGLSCYSLCQTRPGGDILIGTNSGLYVYRRQTNTTELLEQAAQLQDKFICAMVSDPKTTTVWISTTKGIWEYDYQSGHIVPHINGNGLACKEYALGAGLYADGRIYFGTSDGITAFSPQQVQKTLPTIGDVHLTGITVNGRPLSPMGNRYELSYRENTLALEFSLLDFRNPENMAYEWRINAADKWQQTDEGENRITLSELQPGLYNIEVRAMNNGILSERPLLIRIIINKPWYKSALAYLVYMLIAAGFAGLVLYNFERQRRRDLEEAKMRFLINATHDIRSPLTLIMGLLEKLKAESEKSLQPYIETIDKNAQRLLLLVNQILDERKIDKGQMKLSCRETNLNDFIAHIYQLFAYNASQRGITYTYEHPEQPIMAWIDRTNFDKVISNLLTNAFKYSFDNGEIVIRLTERQGRAEIQVIDSGMGFDDDKTERFFERFYQGKKSKDLHIDGTGIGLNLSRAITEMHGGTISAQNRKGDGQTGAILTISLPLGKNHLKPDQIETPEQQEATGTEGTVQKQKSNSNLHILLVDDDPEIGKYISSELGAWYHFHYANNGREALKLLLAVGGRQYDLVISDIMMPEMDGITLLRSIKQNPNISHIPVVLLTSKSEISYRLEGLKKGADAYLAKPFSMEELHILIDNIVNNIRRLRGKFTGAVSQEDQVEPIKVKGNDDILMEKIMKVINAHLSDSELSIDMLTKEVGISRAQLHRKMKEITGISASEFIRNLRMEQAARLIREKKINISQVTYSVGFNNQAHFSTTFKKYFGMTPTEYAEGATAPDAG